MKLAINGGLPVRTRPFPQRQPFGKSEIKEVTEAINSQNLLAPTGTKVAAFEKKFARFEHKSTHIACPEIKGLKVICNLFYVSIKVKGRYYIRNSL